eukprot:1560317-Amphidinium_carterae.1
MVKGSAIRMYLPRRIPPTANPRKIYLERLGLAWRRVQDAEKVYAVMQASTRVAPTAVTASILVKMYGLCMHKTRTAARHVRATQLRIMSRQRFDSMIN